MLEVKNNSLLVPVEELEVRVYAPDDGWEDPVSLDYEGKESEEIFTGIKLKTPFFTLKAPKVRIKDRGKRYKIWILSRVKEE